MGFLDKYEFPNQAVYNLKTKEGGSKCSGSAEVETEIEVSDLTYFKNKLTIPLNFLKQYVAN